MFVVLRIWAVKAEVLGGGAGFWEGVVEVVEVVGFWRERAVMVEVVVWVTIIAEVKVGRRARRGRGRWARCIFAVQVERRVFLGFKTREGML